MSKANMASLGTFQLTHLTNLANDFLLADK